MKRRTVLIASLFAGSALALGVQAAPPEGKGPGHNPGHSGQGGNGNSNKGHPDKGPSAKGKSSAYGKMGSDKGDHGGSAKRSGYDARGRNYDYFDDRRDNRGHYRGGDGVTDLVYAGITAALAHQYALDYGLSGYSSLPPGIRKNLARGKPLPPGIAKKMVPGPLLGRLPRYPGYEWRVVGSDLILIAIATAIVSDILYDVFD